MLQTVMKGTSEHVLVEGAGRAMKVRFASWSTSPVCSSRVARARAIENLLAMREVAASASSFTGTDLTGRVLSQLQTIAMAAVLLTMTLVLWWWAEAAAN